MNETSTDQICRPWKLEERKPVGVSGYTRVVMHCNQRASSAHHFLPYTGPFKRTINSRSTVAVLRFHEFEGMCTMWPFLLEGSMLRSSSIPDGTAKEYKLESKLRNGEFIENFIRKTGTRESASSSFPGSSQLSRA